jgi:restriction system protein
MRQGGFAESLHAARSQARAVEQPVTPRCPRCGKPMVSRCAKSGSNATFWGCSGYPECRGTRPTSPTSPTGRTSPTQSQ